MQKVRVLYGNGSANKEDWSAVKISSSSYTGTGAAKSKEGDSSGFKDDILLVRSICHKTGVCSVVVVVMLLGFAADAICSKQGFEAWR